MKRKSKEHVEEEIVKSQEAIRKKFKKLKLNAEASREYLKSSLKPITEPLNTIVKSNAAVENIAKRLETKEQEDKQIDTDHDMTNYFDSENDGDETLHYDSQQEEEEEVGGEKKKQEEQKVEIDPLLESFFKLHSDDMYADDLDKKYGIRSDGNRWLLGNSPIAVQGDKIIIKNKAYQGSHGLYELLFLKKPNDQIYNKKDLETYKEMLLATNAHKQQYSQHKPINSNKSNKYNFIIKGLLSKRGGGGSFVNLNSVRYEYWDDPNELVDRLRLLVASHQAGNTNVNNEIISIIEELREAGIIE
jgi:hypothetical protein